MVPQNFLVEGGLVLNLRSSKHSRDYLEFTDTWEVTKSSQGNDSTGPVSPYPPTTSAEAILGIIMKKPWVS